MSAVILRHPADPDRLRQDEFDFVRGLLVEGIGDVSRRPILGEVLEELLDVVDRRSASRSRRTFLMLYPAQFRSVVSYLLHTSARPMVAVELWTVSFEHLHPKTGEILLSRDQLASEVGVTPRDVSEVMSELVEFGAIIRRRERVAGMRGPGVARYFVNPNVATRLPGKARDKAQAAAPPIFKVIDGSAHPSQRRPRAAVSVLPVV